MDVLKNLEPDGVLSAADVKDVAADVIHQRLLHNSARHVDCKAVNKSVNGTPVRLASVRTVDSDGLLQTGFFISPELL